MAYEEQASGNEEQDALAQLQYLQGVYTQRYEMLNEQITAYSITKDALRQGMDVVEKAETIGNSGMLVNAGGGTYIEARAGRIDKLITYVGAGYMAEKPLAEAKEFLQNAIKNGEASITKLLNERQKAEKELFDISYRLAAFGQA